jgi:hypothetical protein
MRRLFFVALFCLLVAGCVVAFAIYSYNKDFDDEQARHRQEIERIKQEQGRLDALFVAEQAKKQQQLAAVEKDEALRLTQDLDGDGLTYAEELALGTSDERADSDGDGIRDKEDHHPAGGGETNTITVHWRHNNQPFTTQFGIAEDKYWYYKDQNRTTAADSKFATPHDPVIQTIAQDIADASVSTGDSCRLCLAIDFVESMTYQYDIDYNANPEYPKYAIETIIDERGDCEDTSFLMASILEALDVDTVLLLYTGHMAVGFASDSCPGDGYVYKEKVYCFLETTNDPVNLGDYFTVASRFKNEKPYVLEVN